MRRSKVLSLAMIPTICVFLLMPAASRSATVHLTCRFGEPAVEALPGGFSRLVFPATIQAGKPGEPGYPFRGIQALLPPGESIARVSVRKSGWRVLGGAHKLYPMQEPLRGVDVDSAAKRFLMNAAAYRTDSWIEPPDARFRTRYLRGHAIATGAVSPVGFRPASSEAGYYGTIDVAIETAANDEAAEALRLLRDDPETIERLSRLVDNPEGLAAYAAAAPSPASDAGDFEYLIVTTSGFASSFQPLADFYTRRGTRAKIMTVEDISTGYAGVDDAARIRNAIVDTYVNNGITHVLLAGDWDGGDGSRIVPYRGLWGEVQSSSLVADGNLPADLYFAALDGTWNADGDGLWGEIGEDDPYSEVAVGRLPADTPEEIAIFINKTTAYQDLPVVDDVRRALLLGEQLWVDPLTYGDDEVELLVGTHTDNGFTTTGIPDDFAIVRKYDRLAVWSKTAVIDEVNAGTSWIGHAGHSNTGVVMRLYRTDVTNASFTNDGVTAGFPIIHSTGCYDGSFDNRTTSGSYEAADCIAEQMVSIDHCAAAFVCNSRYGWFNEGQTSGPSIHFMREFFDAVFTEAHTTLGEAHQRSKDETVPFLDLPDEWEPGAVRWCFYELNLLGDPALDAWTDTPESLSVSHPAAIGRYDSGIAVETGVSGAVACLFRGGVSYARAVADATGHIDLVRSLMFPDSVSWVELSVKAHDRYLYRDTISIVETTSAGTPLAVAKLDQNFPNPFNPATVIRFTLSRDDFVDLRVYDAGGREVACLARGRAEKGPHAVTWSPRGLACGVYLYVLKTGESAIARKAVLLR